jgi:hypothetical protein
VPPKSLHGSRRPDTHLAAFSSVGIRPGIPPSSALRCTHLDDANRKELRRHDTRDRGSLAGTEELVRRPLSTAQPMIIA